MEKQRLYTIGEILKNSGEPSNHNGTLLGAFDERAKAYGVLVAHGILTVNEVRKLEQLPPLPENE